VKLKYPIQKVRAPVQVVIRVILGRDTDTVEEGGTVVYLVERLEDDTHVELIITLHQFQSLVEDITMQLMMKYRGLDQDTDQEVREVVVHRVLGLVRDRVPDLHTAEESTSHQRSIVVILNQRELIERNLYIL
jgi:hypothetical protein